MCVVDDDVKHIKWNKELVMMIKREKLLKM